MAPCTCIRIFSKPDVVSFSLNAVTVHTVFGIRVYVWTVKYDSKTLRMDADFFYTEKNISVFGNTRVRVSKASVLLLSQLCALITFVSFAGFFSF